MAGLRLGRDQYARRSTGQRPARPDQPLRLPHGHPARALGKISDTLLLDENDILTEVDSHPRVRA